MRFAVIFAAITLAAASARADTFAIDHQLPAGRHALLLEIESDGTVHLETIPLVAIGDHPDPDPGPEPDPTPDPTIASQVERWAREVDRPAEAAQVAMVYSVIADQIGKGETTLDASLERIRLTLDGLSQVGMIDADAWRPFRENVKGILLPRFQQGRLAVEDLRQVAAGLESSGAAQLPPIFMRLIVCAVTCAIQGDDDFFGCFIGCLLDLLGAEAPDEGVDVGRSGCCCHAAAPAIARTALRR